MRKSFLTAASLLTVSLTTLDHVVAQPQEKTQENKPATAKESAGLKVGESVPGPFRMFIAADERLEPKSPNNRTDRMHCFVCESELNPTIFVFTRTAISETSPGVKVAQALNGLVNEYRSDKLGAYVAFLTLADEYPNEKDRDNKAKAVKDIATQVKTTNVPFGLAAGKSAQTDLFGLKETDETTIVFFDRTKIVKVWTFTADQAPSETDMKAVVDTVKKQLKK